MNIIVDALVNAIIKVVVGDLSEQNNLSGFRKSLRGDSPAQLALKRSVNNAFTKFEEKYPELAMSFFDKHFLLKDSVVKELSLVLTPNKNPDSFKIAETWEKQFRVRPKLEITEPIMFFLDTFEKQIQTEADLRLFADSRALNQLYDIAKTNEEQLLVSKGINNSLDEIKNIITDSRMCYPYYATPNKEISVAQSKDLPTLIVEDDLLQRKELSSLLSRSGYKVITTTSAKNAITIVKKCDCTIKVVIMDIKLSGQLDGIDAVKHIQLCCPDIQIIFVTGYAHVKEYQKKVFQDGAVVLGWVDKPIIAKNKEKLLNLLEIAYES